MALVHKEPAMYALRDHFSQLANGSIQVPSQPLVSYIKDSLEPEVAQFYQGMQGRSGPLFKHFLASLPCIGEELSRVGTTIKRLQKATGEQGHLFEADAFDGTFGRTVAETTLGQIRSVCCSPNAFNHEVFLRANDHNWSQHHAVGIDQINLKQQQFDFFYEMAAFQFYGPERATLLKKSARLLSGNGVGFFLEKCKVGDESTYQKNEDIKDQFHKSRYFTREEVEWKKSMMLSQMKVGEISVHALEKQLRSLFKYVDLMWQGGNFFEFVVFNDAQTRETFWGVCPAISEPDYFKHQHRPLSLYGGS